PQSQAVYPYVGCAASAQCAKAPPGVSPDSRRKCAGITIFFRIISSKAIITSLGSTLIACDIKDMYAFACRASSAAITPHILANNLSPELLEIPATRRCDTLDASS